MEEVKFFTICKSILKAIYELALICPYSTVSTHILTVILFRTHLIPCHSEYAAKNQEKLRVNHVFWFYFQYTIIVIV